MLQPSFVTAAAEEAVAVAAVAAGAVNQFTQIQSRKHNGSHLWADIAEHDISSGSDPAFYLTATAVTAQAWDKANGGANCVGGDTFWQAFTAELSETTISSVENSRSIGIPDGGASKLHSFFMAMVKASSG